MKDSELKFNGVTYHLSIISDTKKEAQYLAKKLRQKGMKARVIPRKLVGGYKTYYVYQTY